MCAVEDSLPSARNEGLDDAFVGWWGRCAPQQGFDAITGPARKDRHDLKVSQPDCPQPFVVIVHRWFPLRWTLFASAKETQTAPVMREVESWEFQQDRPKVKGKNKFGTASSGENLAFPA